jgi:arabinofuranosyltransferase
LVHAVRGFVISSTTLASPADADPEPSSRRLSGAAWNRLVIGVTLIGFGALIWNRRWISDDGLIVLRTVRQLLAGEGPVFNVGERVEANTSTLWTYLLAVPGLVPGVSLNWTAVLLGLVFSVAGLGFGMDAARRLAAPGRRVLPLGAAVVVVLPPFWDFGTSGLETGLIVGWLGFTWWLLVRRLEALRAGVAGRAWPTALVLGLAPLVRPDLALFGLLVAVVLVLLEWRLGWRRLLGLAGVAAAVPLAYEVFRAGYYGLLVPSTALAKEASTSRWSQGLLYLRDLTDTYWLAVPLLALLVAGGFGLWRLSHHRRPRWATLAVAGAPVLAAGLLSLYVIRVGGDFMHGRMLLPALFALALPVMVVPLAWRSLAPVLVTAVWAVVALLALRPAYDTIGPGGIANERLYYVSILGVANPIVSEDYLTHPVAPEGVAALEATDQPSIGFAVPGDDKLDWLLLPEAPGTPDTINWLNLGVTGELAPLDMRVHDAVGLVNALAAHASGLPDGRIGHDKDLPASWFMADAGLTDAMGFRSQEELDAARAALACPATQELLASVRAPLTAERFWANLVGSVERTGYRYDRDPVLAARCDT